MATKSGAGLEDLYRAYLETIRNKDLDGLSSFVSNDVVHNGKKLGLQGYKDLIRNNISETDVDIEIKRLVSDDNTVAALLTFSTRAQTKELVGVKLDGRPFSYAENVFYDFKAGKIVEVFSLFDIDTVRSHAQQ